MSWDRLDDRHPPAAGGRLAAWRLRWYQRMVRFAAPEVIAGALIAITWTILAVLGSVPLLLTVVLMAISLLIHLAAVESGNHALLWATTGWLLILMIIAAEGTFGGLRPLSYAIASLTILGHNELVRVSYARRRGAEVDEEVYVASAIGVGLAGVVAVIGIGGAQALAGATGRTWLWMPAAALVLIALGALLTVLPARNAPRPHRHRWRPGDRIPPQPLGQETTTTAEGVVELGHDRRRR